MPVVPKPAYLTQVQEPTYHGLLTRIAGDADSPYGPCSENSCNWTQVVRQNYSKIQPWNSNSVLLAIDNNDAGPGYGPSHLLIDGSHYGVVQNSNYPYPGLYEYRWHPSTALPWVQINANSQGTELKWVNVLSGLTVPGHDWLFPTSIFSLIGIGEGNPSDDGRYIALGRTTADASGHYTTHIFAIDMVQNQVGDTTWTVPDCDLAPDNNCKAGWFGISPDGNYLVVKYAAQDGVGTNDDCIRVFDFNHSGLSFTPHAMSRAVTCVADSHGSPVDPQQGWVYPLKHADMALVGGAPYLIGINGCKGSETSHDTPDYIGRILRVDLATGNWITLSAPNLNLTKHYGDEAPAMHVSCRNLDRPGWCFVSYDRPSTPNTKRFDNEIIALSTDGLGSVERFAHQHSNNSTGGYPAEPHAVPSRDGHRVVWGSNWCWPAGEGCTSGDALDVKPYVIDGTCLQGGCPTVAAWTSTGWRQENSILARSTSSSLAPDSYRLKNMPQAVNGKYRIQLHESEQDITTLDHVRLAYLDHSADVRAYALGDRVVLGTRTPPFRVTTQGGDDVTRLVNGTGDSYFVGQPGDTLLVHLLSPDSALAPPPAMQGSGLDPVEIDPGGGKDGSGLVAGTGAAALTPQGPRSDNLILGSTGILIQGRDTSGTWTTVRQRYPRQDFDEFLVDTLDHGPLRLVFVGQHKLRFVGRVTPTRDAMAPQALALSSAIHSRLGDVRAAVSGPDGVTTPITPGDLVTFEFDAVPASPGQQRDFFLYTKGYYKSLPALDEPGPATPPPLRFALQQNRPNPFSTSTSIQFELPVGTMVRLELFDMQGRRVATLANRFFLAGRHIVEWDGRSESGALARPGIYVYRISAGTSSDQRQLVLLP